MFRPPKRIRSYLQPLAVGLLFITLCSCGEEPKNHDQVLKPKAISEKPNPEHDQMIAIQQGEQLRFKYCIHCHEVPSPSSLPKESWPEAMRSMNMLFVHPNRVPLISRKIPSGFQYDPKEFIKIGRYMMEYSKSEKELLAEAPQKWSFIPDSMIEKSPAPFLNGHMETHFEYHQTLNQFSIGLAGPRGYSINFVDSTFNNVRAHRTNEAPVDLFIENNHAFVATMGGIDKDNSNSEIIKLDLAKSSSGSSVGKNLARSNDLIVADFDGDNNADVLHVGFGDNTGKGEISMLWGGSDNSFSKTSLLVRSGGLKAEIVDFNKDQQKDLLILFAQNHQELLLLENQGHRRFKARKVIDRPVGWGYMTFELIDMDGDGHRDLVTVVGNNMELKTKPYKPYHGIYIWKNNGHNKFREESFYPFIGASQIEIGDFNGDGLVDFAATSLTPHWESYPVTFGLWIQTKEKKFIAHTLSDKSWGRFCLLTSKAGQKADELWLLSSALPIGLPPNPSKKLQESLASPPYLLKFNLQGL